MNKDSIKQLFSKIKERKPLIHHITNNVTINDCANATLAIGGSPVMATSIEEVADMASLSNALVINFGTINDLTYSAMIRAGQAANEKGIPVVFDPVGVGATPFRTEKAVDFLNKVDVSIIRGNATEVFALIGGKAVTRGVDAGDITISKEDLAIKAARRLNAITVISGEIDVISDGEKTVKIANGDVWLTRITGTGCMTASLIGCFAGITDDLFSAAIAGMSAMSLAGERARNRLQDCAGIGTYRMKLMDEISLMDEQLWEEGVRLA
ncbi:hydroxyethylthiazole kinase [Bacillus sp. DTU_2020_1000418_1_SI_GHA_SEK_038]|uniref:hydroxyethylthiazole kinase n=1 Tax=Bacillus sp. DTU_2020_1000418_1_SI_GHA_SEK_038 TaxID=3077585 RepID=UPI0028E25BA7|nr:hydroxyethylthiazole kinase [Bacillus sp. DTU_2020_1000418_1_SI_GHA_SEK_038]WNS77480.1 hydroxyethylthiazole kinase [Bacillus sp. DTU_2020_1000418_1_SI_GHA_SEK_038]